MPSKFDPKKHYRRSIRLKGYDYTQSGAYFITICTHGRMSLFGDIIAGELRLNRLGQIAQQEWSRLPGRFPLLQPGAFVVMPNHVHGILIITGRGTADTEMDLFLEDSRRAPTSATTHERFGRPVRGSIPTMIRSYKSSATWLINRLRERPDHPVWQRNYYEHVVRNCDDWERIQTYISNNPRLWDEDAINPNR